MSSKGNYSEALWKERDIGAGREGERGKERGVQ